MQRADLTAFEKWQACAELMCMNPTWQMKDTGLIIGRVADSGKPPFLKAAQGLFDSTMEAKQACEVFLEAVQVGPKPEINPALVRMPNAVHTAVFAATGVGKGVSCVVPFLMSNPESTVVVDFKGENARLTAKHRKQAFGHRVVILDPFRAATKQSATFNPLDFIDKDSPTAPASSMLSLENSSN